MTRTLLLVVTLGLGLGFTGPRWLHAQAVSEIQVAPPTVSLTVGQRTSVFATAYDAKGNALTLQEVRWVSSNPAVLEVQADAGSPDVAVLIGVAPGAATVEARVGSRKGSATVQVGGGAAPAGPPPTASAAPVAPAAVAGAGAAAVLKVEPSSLFLLPSEAFRLTPIFFRDDGSPATPTKVTWKSLVPSVATVDADGQVIALAEGQGLVEATAGGGLVARVPVAVALARLAVARAPASMSPGTVDTLTITVPEQSHRALTPNAFRWRSTDDGVVRVSPFGVITAVGGGRAEIVAAGFLQEIHVPITVHKTVEYLRLSPPARAEAILLPLGGTQRFLAEAQAADGSPVPEAPIKWTLLDSSVVGFDPNTGLMTPKRIGTTRLRVSVVGGGLDTAWTVSVLAGGVRMAVHRVALGTGDRLKVSASYTDDSGRPIAPASAVRWTSSTPAVAQVDNDGNVVGVGFGRAKVIATTPWAKADTVDVLVQGELLISSTRAGTPDIYALDRQAPAILARLTNDSAADVAPAYSPDGTAVVFVASKDGNQDIWVMDADGANRRRLTTTPAQEDSPEWTTDGKQIVYASNAAGSYQIWIMNADGTEQRPLTQGPAFNFQPAVSPDGKTIAFTSTRTGNYDIFLMDLDGTNQRNVTNSPGKETNPAWFPDGRLGYLQEQRTGTGRNVTITNVVVRSDLAAGQSATLTSPALPVTDFAVSRDGQVLALVVSVPGQGGLMWSRLYLLSLAPGASPVEMPLATPNEEVFAPAFRR